MVRPPKLVRIHSSPIKALAEGEILHHTCLGKRYCITRLPPPQGFSQTRLWIVFEATHDITTTQDHCCLLHLTSYTCHRELDGVQFFLSLEIMDHATFALMMWLSNEAHFVPECPLYNSTSDKFQSLLETLQLWSFDSTGVLVESWVVLHTTQLDLFIFGKFLVHVWSESEWRFEWTTLYLDSLGTKHILTSLVYVKVFHHFHDISSHPESAILGTKSCTNFS